MGVTRKILAILIALLVCQDVLSVVNNGRGKTVEEETQSNAATTSDTSNVNKNSDTISVAAGSSEEKSNRREAQLDPSYGVPLGSPSADSYLPSSPGNPNLPVPVYGVPDTPSNNIIYPLPPPDIPPPPSVNVAQNQYLSPPPKLYGSPNIKFNVPLFSPRKPFGPGKIRNGPPRFQYGPPGKPLFNTKFKKYHGGGGYKFSRPHNTYGPPVGGFKKPGGFNHHFNGENNHLSHSSASDLSGFSSAGIQTHVVNLDISSIANNLITGQQYGAPEIPYPTYGVPQVSSQYGPPDVDILGPKSHYGPPQPSSHPKPPHPGAPAPPTPPDIKYDGWQPIPGLVSRVPESSYGVPQVEQQHSPSDHSYDNDLIPPPPADGHVHHHDSAASHGSLSSVFLDSASFSSQANGVKDSYGAPLNTVTGSGDVVRTSGNDAISSQNGHLSHGDGHHGSGSSLNLNTNYHVSDSYGAPPRDAYSPTGPYRSAHSSNSLFSSNKYNKFTGSSISDIGLIPPSGLYGIPPSSQYGTPLFSQSGHKHEVRFNAPKHPIALREPVPVGLIDSITNHQSYDYHQSPTYLPPPVNDVPRPSKEYGVPSNTNIFGSTNQHSTSFQNVLHGSSSNSFNLNLNEGLSSLSSYNAPLGTLEGSYGLPGKSNGQLGGDVVSLDLSHPGLTIDLTQDHSSQSLTSLSHDCNQKIQQQLPSLSYGVPSANSYSASLSTLTTNIGGGHQNAPSLPIPQAQLGYQIAESHESYSDLSTAHTQKVTSEVRANSIENDAHGKEYGKSVAQSFGPSSELIQSQSIDLNNIPLQGALGSYSLQIQSADGKTNGVPHGQVLNDGLLQSILAAIEQPQKGGPPVIQLQQSLEKQNFVTNDTISSVVEQLADAEIRHSTHLAKDAIEKQSSELDAHGEQSAPELTIALPTSDQEEGSESKIVETEAEEDKQGLQFLEDRGIALYFNKNVHLKKKQAAKKSTDEEK